MCFVIGITVSVSESPVAIECGILDLQRIAIATGNQLHNVPILEGILGAEGEGMVATYHYTVQLQTNQDAAMKRQWRRATRD